MKPNAKEYNPDQQYIKDLIGSTGLTRPALAAVLGVDRRTIDRWISGDRQFNYRDQFVLEVLVLGV